MSGPAPDALADLRAELVRRDPALAEADRHAPPLEWRTCARGVEGLAWMIVGQQVSTTSAAAVWGRLLGRLEGPVTAQALAALDDADYRAAGYSGQKIRYTRLLANAVLTGAVALDRLPADDDAAVAELLKLKGVGRWTAETYLLMGEGRLDVFPGGDIAIQEALKWSDCLTARPDERALYTRAEAWRPLRGVAAHLLWAWYVAVKGGGAPEPEKPRSPS